MTTRKAKKVKPAPMKPWEGYCPVNEHGNRAGPVTVCKYDLTFPHLRNVRVLVTELGTPSLAAKVEEVRRECEDFARQCPAMIGRVFAKNLLAILNTPTPTAKGAKRK